MTNRYELTCQYCGYSWEIQYAPNGTIYCHKCKDSSIKAKDLHRDKIDYYAGSPPFEEKEDKEFWHL